jgi:hypothetical protein
MSLKQKNYGFADGNGREINRGVQLWHSQAYDMAQMMANERNIAVDYWEEDAPKDEDGANSTLTTVEPE